MVERFNGRISEVVNQTRFASAAELETTLKRYVNTYNQQIPQRALNHLSPIQALKEWQKKKPELFKKRIYNQAGLDIYVNDGPGLLLGSMWNDYSYIEDQWLGRVKVVTLRMVPDRITVEWLRS